MEVGDRVVLREDSKWAGYMDINPPSGEQGVIININENDPLGLEIDVGWDNEKYPTNSYPWSDLKLI